MKYENQTALITGASSGIGEAFAHELAAEGANLVLVARRLDRLQKLASDLEKTYGRKVVVMGIDLTQKDAVANLNFELEKLRLDVDVLVNNAGFGTSGMFVEEDLERVTSEINLNITALVSLTRTFVSGMLGRNRGLIINIASTAAFQPVPTMAVYGATKAFVLSFTEALWAEVMDTDLKVIALCPGATDTAFFEIAGSQGTGSKRESPTEVVQTVMAELSRRKSRPSIVSGSRNRVMSQVPRLVTRGFMSKLSLRVMKPE